MSFREALKCFFPFYSLSLTSMAPKSLPEMSERGGEGFVWPWQAMHESGRSWGEKGEPGAAGRRWEQAQIRTLKSFLDSLSY